jgi:chromosome segregation ATPase
MIDDQIKTIISCPECATRLSITTSQTDPKAFTCSNPSCRVLFTVLPDLSVQKGDHRKSYRQKIEVMSKIRSIQDQLSGIPESDALEEKALLNDLKEMIKAMKEKPSEELSRLESMLKERDDRIGHQDAEIVRLKDEIALKEKAIDEAKAKRSEEEKELSQLSLTSSDPELEKKFRALQQKFKEQAATLKDWQARLEKNGRDLSAAQAAKEKAEVRIASMYETEKSLQEESILLDDREMELDTREKEAQSKESDLSTREEGARLCEDDLNRTKAEIAALQAMLGPLRSQMEREKEVLKREREDLLALKASIPVDEDLSSKRATPPIEGTRASEIEKERIRLSDWEKDLKTMEDRLSATSSQAGAGAQDDPRITKLKEALQKKNDEISSLKTTLNEVRNKATEPSGSEARMRGMLEDKVEENSKLKLALTEAEGRYTTASGHVERVEALERENATLNGTIEALRSELEMISSGSKEAQEQPWRAEMDARGSMLSQKIAEVEKRERELSDYSGQLTSYHAELTKRFEDFGVEYSRFQEERVRLGSSGSALQQTTPSDNARLEKAESEAAALRTELEAARKEIEKRNAAIIRMQEKMGKTTPAPAAPSVDTNAMMQRDAEIGTLRTRILELEDSVVKKEGAISSIRERTEREDLRRTEEHGMAISERDRIIAELRAQLESMSEPSKASAGSEKSAAAVQEGGIDRTSAMENEIGALRAHIISMERSAKDHTEAGSKQETALALLREKFAQAVKANKELSDERLKLNAMIEDLRRSAEYASNASAQQAEKERRIVELEGSLAEATAAVSASASSGEEQIGILTAELARVKDEAMEAIRRSDEELAKERKALADEKDRLGKEAEAGKERLRQKLQELSSSEKSHRPKVAEGPRAETLFECPYCKSSIPEKGIESGSCPACSRRFKVTEELVIEIYECPSCGRTLSKNSLAEGACAFCAVQFKS